MSDTKSCEGHKQVPEAVSHPQRQATLPPQTDSKARRAQKKGSDVARASHDGVVVTRIWPCVT